jgi:hypothetical protein
MFLSLVAIIFSIFIGYNIYSVENSQQTFDVSFLNIEALAHFLSYKRRYTHKNLQNYNIYSTVDFPTLPNSNKLITAVGKYS